MSTLSKGQLYHNRYLLEKPLGQGASAEVWMAKDTKANNLRVALKIFTHNSELSSYGLQNFEREFTTVYNIKHSNLLPPTGYDICDGRPYLVMQYCENGSCNGMLGRVNEEEIIKFLHDVSAGLEYLHDHNIIHQDIKPDNILLDDNCNFLVTDFGISVNSANGVSSSKGMSGGTVAYMGPERFEGITNDASDMWSLGATAVEMLTGIPPFGEHGGRLQAAGEPLPKLPKLQPEVRDLILGCLAQDPNKRITASQIRQKIDLYYETGSWKQHSSKKAIIMSVTAVVGLLMCLGIYLWDYNRTKIYYYKDYAEYWGVPKGIGALSQNEVKNRNLNYKFEYDKRKLRRVSLVNAADKVVPHRDTETMNSRYSDMRYFYTDNGKIDYVTIYDTNGTMLFKMDYDDNLKTVTFRQNDEYGTEMNLKANANVLNKNGSSILDEKSRISRYLLSYDDDGLLTERRYVGLQNVPACDKNNIYGSRFRYDEKGRRIEESYIGADGNIICNSDGMAIREYTYDDNDDWTSVTYLNAERKGSHDGNNCTLVKIEYDEYGNRIKELYCTLEGEPSVRKDRNVSGYSYEYENGNNTKQTCLDLDGMPTYCNDGYVSVLCKYNNNGFIEDASFVDENDDLILRREGELYYSRISWIKNETDQPLELIFYDEDGNKIDRGDNVARVAMAYDENGNCISEKYYDVDDNAVLLDGFFHEMKLEYDEFNNVVLQYYLNEDGEPATQDGIIHKYVDEYNRQNAVTKLSFLDVNGDLVLCSNLYAGFSIDYDELGNQKYVQYFDTKGEPTISNEGYSRSEYVYDKETNFLTKIKNYDSKGKLLYDINLRHDNRGNVIERYTLVDGKLKSGTGVEHTAYDGNNQVISTWSSDLKGNKIILKENTFAEVRIEYDNNGNPIIQSYWKPDGSPAVDALKTHRRVKTFDNLNREISEINYGIDGKPISGNDVSPEGRVVYDKYGNLIEILCYDGYGQPRLSADGFHKSKRSYDKKGRLILEELFDTNGQPVISKNNGYAKAEKDYDERGNAIEIRYFDKTKCFKVEKDKYNQRNQLIECSQWDAKGNLTDEFYGFAKYTIDYDNTTSQPKILKFYNKSGQQIGSRVWNTKTNEWGELILANSYSNSGGYGNSGGSSTGGGSWQDQVREAAKLCPTEVDNGVVVQSVKWTSNSVTMTIKMVQQSKYDLEVSEDELRENGKMMKDAFRSELGMPSNVSLTIIILDKADRTIVKI